MDGRENIRFIAPDPFKPRPKAGPAVREYLRANVFPKVLKSREYKKLDRVAALFDRQLNFENDVMLYVLVLSAIDDLVRRDDSFSPREGRSLKWAAYDLLKYDRPVRGVRKAKARKTRGKKK